ncbi:hypothetical protein N692_07635 [Lactiplantibacillus plantarum EGD-AQ4]|nr:hypothetical protein N692_07635 [Lactiplantibacillus plantarum EGD-AQ4]
MSMLFTRNHQFIKDNKPFFYLADTCWSAFTNISEEDWQYYLNYRHQQGFNVIQINLLKQWDASGHDLNIYPFAIEKKENGYTFDYSKINVAYFDRVERMLEVMKSKDMTPALVLLWSNYVPGTWAAKLAHNNLFPFQELKNYVTYVTKRFKKFNPIYFVSGDTDFPTDQTIQYYREVFHVAKSIDPDALYSFHIKGRFTGVPEEFLTQMDFFSYQSGHSIDGQSASYLIPVSERKIFDGPIVNTEPCYDQISDSRHSTNRFTSHDVRIAAWSSVLSGANAGITYGAHGIWSWHHAGASFGIVKGEGFDVPFDWHDALRFRGASDLAFLKQYMLSNFKDGYEPSNIVLNDNSAIRLASNTQKTCYTIYLPINIELDVSPLGFNKQNAQVTIFDLQHRTQLVGDWVDQTTIGLSNCLEDVLIKVESSEV